jgi:uridine kinase
MFIFIRGIPGSGKTSVSTKLSNLLNWEIIHVDLYKKEYMENNPDADFIEEIIPYSYKTTIAKLKECKNKNLIIEEIFRNHDFIKDILNSCKENRIDFKWFKIKRDMGDILKVESERKRKIKNTKEELENMQREMNNIIIEGEIDIYNENIDDSVRKILKCI